MKVTTQWNIGQFLTTINAEVNEDKVPDALSVALRHEGQRCTSVDKVLGGFETIDGKEKRRASYKRNEVEYSEELAGKLADALTKFLTEAKEGETPIFTAVEIDLPTKYEGSVVEPKYAAEKRAVSEYLAANGGLLKDGVSKRTVESFCGNRGITPPKDSAKYGEDVEFLTAVKAWLKSVAQAE